MIELSSEKETRKMLKSKAFKKRLKRMPAYMRPLVRLEVVKRHLHEKYGYPVDENTTNLKSLFILETKTPIVFSDYHKSRISELMTVELEKKYSLPNSSKIARAASRYLNVDEDGYCGFIYAKEVDQEYLAVAHFLYHGTRLEVLGFRDENGSVIKDPVKFFEEHPIECKI